MWRGRWQVEFVNVLHKPGPIFNFLAQAAFADGADYVCVLLSLSLPLSLSLSIYLFIYLSVSICGWVGG